MSDFTKIKKVVVSDLFLEIYKNFNIFNQVEQMKALSKRELYLLLVLCLDKFEENDSTVNLNLSSFSDEMKKIFQLQDEIEVDDVNLKLLVDETGDKYIETDNIVDLRGNSMPKPLKKEEVRDLKINLTLK